MDERELIERAVTGDATAERVLYDQHVGNVYRMAYRMTADQAWAEDLTQETFVRAFDRLAEFELRARFSTWLHRIALHTVIDALRRTRRRREQEQAHPELELVAPGLHDPDRTLRLALHAAIDALNEGMRSVLVMHDIEGYTHAEIAEALGVEEGTSKARLSRARARLRQVLVENGTVDPPSPRSARAPRSPHSEEASS